MLSISITGKESSKTQAEICPLDLAIGRKMEEQLERNCA